jgi:geranylgeranyl diphosphate synthase type I
LAKVVSVTLSHFSLLAGGWAPESVESLLVQVETLIEHIASAPGRAGEMVNEHLATGGKRLRARLALTATEAMGADPQDAVAWATAVELLHQATLIHDDIQDGDVKRRGQDTVWVRHGRAQAINAGDLLLMLPYLAIAEAPLKARGPLSGILAAHAVQTVIGQVDEIDLLTQAKAEWADYLGAIRGKTGSLMALPVHGAAILAGYSPAQSQRMSDAFVSFGTLFQLQDDVLDLYGNKGRDRVGSDLYEGKVSALVVAHLVRKPEDKQGLMTLLKTPRHETREADVLAAIDTFRDSGALRDVLEAIETLATEIIGHPGLMETPALQRLAEKTVNRATYPIAAIMSEVRNEHD